jgi:neutral trehalase
MYDGARFDPEKHLMMLADVGLMSLYVMDCNALADLAAVVNRPDVRKELLERAGKYGRALETLWDEKTGSYLNKDLLTGELSHRLSPTLFYPLLARVPDRRKAGRMIAEHLENPEEFWGQWVLPSISRNDPAYSNQYWRGRIWGPMNFLVYLGLRNYDLAEERAALVERSRRLLLRSFRRDRTVHENYDPDTGEGTSDDYYHWGALLGFMTFLEGNRK